jgi:hypothetical protein
MQPSSRQQRSRSRPISSSPTLRPYGDALTRNDNLTAQSQHENIKLRDIATRIVSNAARRPT